MAIRIREINGRVIALCAAKTKPKEGDLYLDDTVHHALSRKFRADFMREGLIRTKMRRGSRRALEKALEEGYKVVKVMVERGL